MSNYQMLHSHTTNSDGKLNHLEVLDLCQKLGISTVAFTDHDFLLTSINVDDLKTYSGPTKWISGVELTSALPKELESKMTSDFHIVGLFVDPTNKDLIKHCELTQQSRKERMKKIVGALNKLGFEITEEECLSASNGEAVGRPHIAKVLMSKEKNKVILNQLVKKMENESKSSGSIKLKYDDMIARGEHQYPYVILLSENAFIPNVYFDVNYYLDLDDVVQLIRRAGGISILAHYFSVMKKISPDLLENIIKDNRIDGIETVFGLFAYGSGADVETQVKEAEKISKELAEKYGILESGGSDAHKPEDFERFAHTADYAKRTEGLVEKMLHSKKENKKWSNL